MMKNEGLSYSSNDDDDDDDKLFPYLSGIFIWSSIYPVFNTHTHTREHQGHGQQFNR